VSEWYHVDPHVRVDIGEYDRAEYQSWCRGERSAFPRDGRLVWWRRPDQCDRGVYFAETVHARDLMSRGYICWSGYYKLFNPCPPSHGRFPNASEIRSALRESNLPDPTKVMERVRGQVGKLRGPDVIAYHRLNGDWKFHEIKKDDSVMEHQKQVLALLRHVYGADVAIVRYVERPARTRVALSVPAAPLEFFGDSKDVPPPQDALAPEGWWQR
jgi:hypothetical protein